jgi:hypothetical protein
MTIAVKCRGCQKSFRANSRFAGKTVKCPGCGDPLKIPRPVAIPADDPDESEFQAPRCPGCRSEIVPGVLICETCGVNVRTGKSAARAAGGEEESLDLWRKRIGDLVKLLFRRYEGQGGMDWGLLVDAYGLGGLIVMVALYLMFVPLILVSSIPLLLMYYRVTISRTDASTFLLRRTGLILPFGPSLEIDTSDVDYMRIVVRVAPQGWANGCRLETFGKSGDFKKLKVGVPLTYSPRDVDHVKSECKKLSRLLRKWTTVRTKIDIEEESFLNWYVRGLGMIFLGIFVFASFMVLLYLMLEPSAGQQ